ncbi:PREDICTED: putative nuclease HARBI1 [Camelina sativa]|uniref:Nuclease HARBI1 n=1 Tax=Camelina sativa TaxID=90675 RepID=A0ABM0ZAH2_CAMSA|nr:PREDICTED: putative nuclease HARBI1 [Camelina sativa]
MAPPAVKKKKKKKQQPSSLDKKKNKKMKAVPVDPEAIDCDWWDTFWHRNSSLSVPLDEDDAFKHFFRASKTTFSYICSLVREDLISRPPSGLINIEGRLLSVEKQVAIALRRLASGDSQVSVGASFGVGQSTVSQVTWRFIESLEERAKHHLRWPDSDRIEEIKSKFEDMYGLPNCCGAIDTTHIIMTLPAVQASDDWCDLEKNYSMFLQGVFDHEMRFLNMVTGWPGGMTVSKLLKFSGFFKLCESGQILDGNAKTLCEGGSQVREYVVGGISYPLLPWLITPHDDSDHPSSDPMMAFNDRHEKVRSVAATAFAHLKGSWRILSKVMWRPDRRKLPSIILVCCLLHNIIIDCGDYLQEDIPLSGHHDAGYADRLCKCKQTDPLGSELRGYLTEYLLR